MPAQWTAIILAGQRPGIDPLALHFEQEWKALVPVAGVAMLTHVLRTLKQCPSIGHIIVITQQPDALATAVEDGGGAQMMSSGDGISASIRAIAGSVAQWPILITTADHPLLTPEMVEEFLAASDGDLSVAMVERETMLARFPDARRTWLHFADGSWSGANLFALSNDRTSAALDLWSRAEQDRKQAWRLFLHFGPILAIRALTRTIGLREALHKAGRRLGLDARLVSMTDPVAAIDVDKPSDHALAEQLFVQGRV